MNVKTINAVVALGHLVDIIISRISIINETVDSSVVDNIRVLLIITLVELNILLLRHLLIRMNHIIVLLTFMHLLKLKIHQH